MPDYNGQNIGDWDLSAPPEGPGGTNLGVLNNSDREIKRCTWNTFGAEHDRVTGKHNVVIPFIKTVTIAASAAGTAIKFFEDTDIPTGKKVYLSGFTLRNVGAAWSGTGSLKIQDNETTPVPFFTIATAALTANSNTHTWDSNVTKENAYVLGGGGTLEKGLQIKATSNGNGGDVTCTVYGIIL